MITFQNRVIEGGIAGIVDPSLIRGLWLFQDEGGSTITDRSGQGHTATLRDSSLDPILASTCSPGVVGIAPFLILGNTHRWATPDVADLSFVEPQAFSGMVLFNCSDATDSTLFTKYQEYFFILDGSDRLVLILGNNGVSYILKVSSSVTSLQGVWTTYGFTYSGGGDESGIQIYLNGASVGTGSHSGVYSGMVAGAVELNGYTKFNGQAGPAKGSMAVSSLFSAELTPTQMADLDSLLRRYAGVI